MKKLKRILALDIGKKRIGVAISDLMQILVSATFLIEVKSQQQAIDELCEICQNNDVETIVFGMPLNMDGSVSEMALYVRDFAEKVKIDCKRVFFDERLTSFEAEENLKRMKKKFTKQNSLIDMEAASIILRNFLEERD